MTPNLRELTTPLRRGLARLRGRLRSLLVLLGTARTLVFLTGALLAFFVADYVLRLPLWVRGALLLGLAGGTGVVLYRRLLKPLARPLDDMRLAAWVEHAHPELQDRLRSSLAFAHAADDPDNDDSPELMGAVVAQTVEETRGLRFVDVARNRRVLRWAGAAAGLLALVLAGAVTRTDLASIFAQRALLLRDVAWPRRTTLVVDGMQPGQPRRVTLGRETTLAVRAEGSVPDRVQLTFWEAAGDREDARRIDLTPSAEDPSLFAFTFRVLTSTRFTVTGGDDDRALVYTVEALTPPAILALEMDVAYPDYLGLPDETLRGGGQRVPEGTQVRLRVRANMPLRVATIAIGAKEPQALAPVDETTFETDLTAETDIRYSIRLVGRNGEANDPGVDTYFLQVAKDQPPSVRVHTPGPRVERLEGGVALVSFEARDDHRVTDVAFVYRVNDGEERRVLVGEAGGDALRIRTAAESPPDAVHGLVAIDLARLAKDDGATAKKGDHVTYAFEVGDSAGQRQTTNRDQRVDLVGEDEIGNGIENRQQELRESVRRATNRARDAQDLLAFVGDARGDPAEFRRATVRTQAAQARVIDDIGSLSLRVQGLLNLYVFNRLHDRSAADQILPFYERHLVEPTDRTGVPFRGPLYRAIATARRERQIRAGGAYGKLIEMADLADRLAVDHGPAAYHALSALAAAREGEGLDRALAEVREAQRTIADGLALLARLMEEWENFDGVVRWFKGLRETEKGIVEQLGGLGEDGR